MNAIISLSHFCEAHGPCSVFCTQTLRDSKIDENLFNFDDHKKNCSACLSIGNNLGMLSHDNESNAIFLSTQMPVLSDFVRDIVKHSATRSLSCEVSKDFVYIMCKCNTLHLIAFFCRSVPKKMVVLYFLGMPVMDMCFVIHFKYVMHKLGDFFDYSQSLS